jgi:hypothetical protein
MEICLYSYADFVYMIADVIITVLIPMLISCT